MLVSCGVVVPMRALRLRVSYNDSYRSIHDIPRYSRVRQYQVEANIDTFDALVRKLLFRFMNRCHRYTNVFVHSLLHSCRFRCSKYVARFIDLLTVNGLGEANYSSLALWN